MSAPLSYSVDGAAKAIGISADEVRELIAAGEINAYAILGRIKRHMSPEDVASIIRRDPQKLLQRIRERKMRPKVEEAPAKCGVYMLVAETRIVYVGRSVNMQSRVQQHRCAGREFSEVRAIPCDGPTSVWLERELIRTLQPTQNITRFRQRAEATEKRLRHIR